MADDDSEDDYVAGETTDEGTSGSGQTGSLHAHASHNRRASKSKQKSGSGGYLSNDYRDLLNLEIDRVNIRSPRSDLGPSQMGASRWTSREKEALFQCVASRGPDDLPALLSAVHTKSEQEIRVYLLLLQDGVANQEDKTVKPQKQSVFTQSDIPAAAEISSQGERILDLAADALAAHVEKHNSQQEHEKFGDDWLIDEDTAKRMELSLQQSQPFSDSIANGVAEADEDVADHALKSTALDASITHLLRPSSFLQLSRSIFMNNGENDELNWHHVDSVSADSMEPALFRTALNDFHNITINIVRRIVQATIFQATSRLRSEDASRKDWTPLGAIREVDVRTAVELLNMPNDSKEYWATAARRCKVGVYSDSKKYADGRRSTKSGQLLTYDEVEAELGSQNAKDLRDSQGSEAHSLGDDDIDDLMEDSDLYTEEEDPEDPVSDLNREHHAQVVTKAPKKRKRGLSPSSLCRVESSYLEALDQFTSFQEEKRLWELLRLDAPEHIALDRKIPVSPLSATDQVENVSDWRKHVDYQAVWEQPSGTPALKRFKDMGHNGMCGKMAREIVSDKVRKRLAASRIGATTKDNFEESNDTNYDKSGKGTKPATSSGSSGSYGSQ